MVGLLAPFGLDPLDEAFWRGGIEGALGTLIDEAERLSQTMGV